MSVEQSVVVNLRDIRDSLAREFKTWEEGVDTLRQKYEQRLNLLDQALTSFSENGTTPPGQIGVPYSIGEDKLNTIRQYMNDHVQARQADICKDLNLNSGLVSVGMRVLQQLGEVKPGEKRNASRVWELVKVPAVA